MNQQREAQVRERAYRLWEADGAPDGKADEYWLRAEQLLDAEDGTTASMDDRDDGNPEDGSRSAATRPLEQSAKRRIPGEPLQDAGAVPPGEVAHERRRKR
ncbi:hypothetical protein WL88_00895 [Burkholderia diffusa]|uniref:DUF2934 domain-containing protein n=1 Tax=Burkholderia diffusa TaxID=488732 RepID=A0AAW3PIR9_9BURK|nr:DUF2934 domain-containing protein [Burkholderia diffusa]AOI61530.1 hypothetical protein WI26_27930 [Burkholderia diffusa]KVC23244.1 hypothetical protein WI69_03965 [Burkholderia diffusa]KVC49130.1 hypothetical protein WI71_07305 [Burkholderia diffusa]KVG25887.1 hypothetical protein WJ30_29035 [Burkholderia diffusa]KVN02324.1 hypothetical protein WJ62_13135 [Burkholderia diffusa]